MNEWLQKFINQLKEFWNKASLMQKIIGFSIIGVVLLGVILLFVFNAEPSMVSLIGTPIKDESLLNRIIVKLDEEIPGQYKVNADSVIMVANEKLAKRIRTILIREDLIPKNADPWQIFDIERWTLTDFERKINVRRAITGSIEQHILAIEDIDAANVVIDIPEDSLFTEDQKPYTASIQITPKPGSDITGNRKKIEGLVKLVKYAISGLKDENIVITDNNGVQLNVFEEMAAFDRHELAKKELKEKANLEKQYKQEILKALQKFYTDDRVEILKLEIDLDMSKESSRTKEYFPITIRPDNPKTPYDESEVVASTTLSSEEKKRDWEGTGINPEGPPGQEGQTPPSYKDMSNFVGHLNESSTIKNEAINERNVEREARPWKMNKISVGVAIDGYWKKKYDTKTGELLFQPDGSIDREYVAVSDQELKTVEDLIKGAIGYDQIRGDDVTVKHLQKDRRNELRAEDDKYRQVREIRNIVFWIVVGIGIILLIIVFSRMLSKYIEKRRQEREEELARQHQAMREAALRTAEEQGMDVELSIEERARLEMQENAINMAREHPEDVAQLIRTWLLEE